MRYWLIEAWRGHRLLERVYADRFQIATFSSILRSGYLVGGPGRGGFQGDSRIIDITVRRAPRIALWIIDEGHHVLEGSEWSKAAALFLNAHGSST